MLNRLRRDWQQFSKLAGPERRWLIQAFLLLPAMAVALRWLGFRRLRAMFSRRALPAGGESGATVAAQAREMARMVEIAARRGFYPATCLHRSLVLWWGLNRRGIRSDLRIGVRKGQGPFEAHAWVECQGIVLNDATDLHQRFTAFDGDIVLPVKCTVQVRA